MFKRLVKKSIEFCLKGANLDGVPPATLALLIIQSAINAVKLADDAVDAKIITKDERRSYALGYLKKEILRKYEAVTVKEAVLNLVIEAAVNNLI